MYKQRLKTALAAVMIIITLIGLISNADAAVKTQVTGLFKDGFDRITKGNAQNSTLSNGTNSNTDSISAVNKEQVEQQPAGSKAVPGEQDNRNKALSSILQEKGITNPNAGLKIIIDKSDRTLTLEYNGTDLKHYDVELGSGGSGDKEVEGDKKTPEGTFFVTDKNTMDPADYYLGSRWLGVSYPNAEDAGRGLEQGLIDRQTYNEIVTAVKNGERPPQNTALGGYIGIHGGSVASFGSNWTWGCIGLKNSDIEDFYHYIGVGTPIIIQK